MKNQFYLILPNIRSCHNVGAMFRTADAFEVTKLFLVGYTAAPPKVQIDKVALGAEKWVPWEKKDDLNSLIKELKDQGVHIYALEKNDTSVSINLTKFHAPLALIVGNEVEGVSKEVLQMCESVVYIPMYGKKESLNVSVAAGIAMHEIHDHLKEVEGK